MTEKERIEFIRKMGDETIQRGMKSIFGPNKYKPKKEKMWNRLDRGKKLVRAILQKRKKNG